MYGQKRIRFLLVGCISERTRTNLSHTVSFCVALFISSAETQKTSLVHFSCDELEHSRDQPPEINTYENQSSSLTYSLISYLVELNVHEIHGQLSCSTSILYDNIGWGDSGWLHQITLSHGYQIFYEDMMDYHYKNSEPETCCFG